MLRLIAAFLFLGTAVARADGCSGIHDIRFPAGKSSTTVEAGIVRTELGCYRFSARAGQTLQVSVTSQESNAVFQVYRPGWKMTDGAPEGATLPGAGEGEDAMHIEDRLPVTGAYVIVVGGTRGNADFKLSLAIH
jgi:hypothetical protein